MWIATSWSSISMAIRKWRSIWSRAVCSQNPALTVMAYSGKGEPDLLVRCMRAGAREFLTDPLSPAVLTEALIRASARRLETDRRKKVSGKMLVFLGR